MKTIDEAMLELIQNRKWYSNTDSSRTLANIHKERFLKGELPYELKKKYLEAAGYEIVIPEVWKKNK